MIDVTTPAGQCLATLGRRLAEKTTRIDRLERYLSGNPDLSYVDTATAARFRAFMRKARLNFAELIVDAVNDRLEPLGFRTGATGSGQADAAAWDIWQANGLDGGSKPFHRTVLGLSEAYMMVGAVDDDTGAPLITPEDPRQVITDPDPSRRWRTRRALKIYHDTDAGGDWAVVFPQPGEVWYAFRERGVGDLRGLNLTGSDWDWVDAKRLPLTRIPVVQYPNRPDLLGKCLGEFEDHIDHLDRLNHMVLQGLVIATLQAYRQRAIRGLPQFDANGHEIDYTGMFESGPDALWQLPGTAEMWESGQVDMTGVLSGRRDDVKDLAAVTRTPLYMLTADAAAGSAEGASLQREGLAFKTRDRTVTLGERHELTMSLAFEVLGDLRRARLPDMEMMWAPVSSLSIAERYDAAAKAIVAGVPWRARMADVLQFTPQQIDRMEQERAAEPQTTVGSAIQDARIEQDQRKPVQFQPPSVPASSSG